MHRMIACEVGFVVVAVVVGLVAGVTLTPYGGHPLELPLAQHAAFITWGALNAMLFVHQRGRRA